MKHLLSLATVFRMNLGSPGLQVGLLSLSLVACSSSLPRMEQAPQSPEAPRSRTSPTPVVPALPVADGGWYCFRNEATPALDNGCGISLADCERQQRRQGEKARQQGILYQPSACKPATTMPLCFWAELDAERVGFACYETQTACHLASDHTSYHLRSSCTQAPAPTPPGYAGGG